MHCESGMQTSEVDTKSVDSILSMAHVYVEC